MYTYHRSRFERDVVERAEEQANLLISQVDWSELRIETARAVQEQEEKVERERELSRGIKRNCAGRVCEPQDRQDGAGLVPIFS